MLTTRFIDGEVTSEIATIKTTKWMDRAAQRAWLFVQSRLK
jgi:hypothetical protein